MTSALRRTALSILAVLAACAVSASAGVVPARADSTEDFPVPRHIIATPCDAEQYLAAARDTSPVYYEQVATHWGNWAKIFFNNKGVVAKATDVCPDYSRGDMSVWNWV
jgi:hypothetical protein